MTALVKDRPGYDEDFYAWTQDQAKRLRAQAEIRRNEPLDWHELAEEIADLGKSELHTCQSLTDQIIAHLLKLQCSGAEEPRAGWATEIAAFRTALERRLTPTIRAKLEGDLEEHFRQALRLVRPSLQEFEPHRLALLPESCPYTLDRIIGRDDWLPA